MESENWTSEELRDRTLGQLKKTFDEIAKTAMRASQECSDDSIFWLDRLHKAHTNIILLMDDAMKGLSKASRIAIFSVALGRAESEST
jgi:hypothetical protein